MPEDNTFKINILRLLSITDMPWFTRPGARLNNGIPLIYLIDGMHAKIENFRCPENL